MIPRTDKLNPPVRERIPTRQVTLEKLVDGELDETIAAAIPAPSTQAHDLLGHQSAYDLTVGSGVNVVVGAGRARIDHTTYIHAQTPMALTVNATNYIKINAAGGMFSSTSPATSGQIPLWAVTTDATSVTSFTDLRAVFSNGGGGGGGGASTLDQAYDGGGVGLGRIIDANDGEVLIRNLEADANANLRIQRAPADIATNPSFQVDALAETNPRLSVYGDRMQGRFDGSAGGSSGADWWIGHYASGVLALHNNASNGEALEFKTGNEPSTPGSNNLDLYGQVLGTSPYLWVKDQNARVFGPIGTKEQATVYGRGTAGGIENPSTAWSDGCWGTLAPAGMWTVTSAATTLANNTAAGGGRYGQFQAAAGVGNDCGIESTQVFWGNKSDSFLFRFAVPTTSSVRMFVGIAAQTLATMVGADNPGTNHVGLQIPTGRANTNFWFVERGTGSQTATDTGQSPGAGTVYYLRLNLGTFASMQLLAFDYSPLATRTVGITGKPGGTTLVNVVVGLENQSGAATREIRLYHMEHHAREA